MDRRFLLIATRVFCLTSFILISKVSAQTQSMPYLDNQFTCLTTAQAQKYTKDFNIDVRAFGGAELCRSEVDFKKLTNDLSLIEFGQFQSTSTGGLIGSFVDAQKYYPWMISQTRGMTRGNNIPTATAYNSGGYFTMQDGWARLSTLGRVGTIIHEARHSAGYRHVPCTTGPYAGLAMDGCDTDLKYGGSHAVEMEYYARVATAGINFHPVYKAMARLMAMARSNFVFNSSPLLKREGLLAQTKDGKLWLLDQGKWYLRQMPSTNIRMFNALPAVLKRTSFGASFFNGIQAFAVDMYENYLPSLGLVDTYSYYKILLDLKTQLKDFEEFDSGAKRYLVQLSLNNQMASFNYGQGRWNSAKKLNFDPVLSTTTLANGQAGFFLVDALGAIYSYSPTADQMSLVNNLKWDAQALTFARVNQNLYSLTKDNRIFIFANNAWTEVVLPQNEKTIQMVSVPLYNIFKVQN